jgi:hypothetical protein
MVALSGQSITGDLVVNVTDPSGAVVGNAKLELTRVDTNVRFAGTSDSLGNFLFSNLTTGAYKLDVSATGFKTASISGINISLGQRARVDAKLEVGAMSQEVSVSATAETLINAESASVGQVLNEQAIVQLPLNGRNFIQLAQITTGAVPIGIGTSPATSWTGRGDSTLSVGGGRETNNSFLVNGIETRNARFGSAGIRPSADAVEEFRVQRSTFGAEFGRSSAIINTTIKGGTNDLHLALYEFLRNRNLDSIDFFTNRAGGSKPAFSQNNFGTAVGGPVVIPGYNGKNRTFWFFNYEGFRQRQAGTAYGTYPSAAQMAGNLADDSTGTGILPANSPLCVANPKAFKCHDVIDPLSGQPFQGNIIPASRLDPIVQKQIPYQLRPNFAVPANQPNFPTYNTIGFPKRINDWDQYNTRIDHHFSASDVLYGTFSNSDETLISPALRPLGGDVFPQTDRLWTATYNRIITPTMVNEFRFGYNRSLTYRTAETSNTKNYAADVFGLKNTSPNPFDWGVPNFNPTGFSGVGSLSEAIGATDTNIQFTDNFSWNTRRHNIRMGFAIARQLYDQITDFAGNPSFNFDGRFTGMQGVFGLGDMLLGYPISTTAALGDSSQQLRTTFYAPYIQDDWHVTPHLTLNFGIRYEYAASPTEQRGKALVFAPDIGQVVLAGHGVRGSIVDPDYNNFAPRFGFAYRPTFTKNTVIRGGFGTYFATDNFNEEQFKVIGPPFYQSQTLNSNPTTPTLLMSQMMPSLSANPNTGPFSFDRHNRTPYINQWSFDIQRSIKQDWMVDLEYDGSTGQKLPQRRNLNIASLDPTGTLTVASRRPFANYSDILLTYNGGWSSYQAMTAKLEKRFSGGFYLLTSYTWSKALDLGSTDDFTTLSRDFKKFDKGHSAFDVPQRLVVSYVYELPFGKGKQFGSNMNPVANLIVGGWQATGISSFAAGQWGNASVGSDWVNVGAWTKSFPNIVGPIAVNRSFPDNYVVRSAFDYPRDANGNPTHLEGNAGRMSIEQPGINNWDMGIFKNTKITEKINTQLRWEMFNVWNHTQFGSANLTMTSASLGKINSVNVGPRRMQLGLRVTF